MGEENFYQIEDEHEIEVILAGGEEDFFEGEKFSSSDELVIEETVPAKWSGVRSCCDQETIQAQFRNTLFSWVAAKRAEHPRLQLVRYHYGATRVSVSCKEDRTWDGRRSCRASMQVPLVAVFKRP